MNRKNKKTQWILNVIFIVLALTIVLPFVMVVSISFSSEQDIVFSGYSLLPKTFDTSAYAYVFRNPQSIIDAYQVTALFSVVGTVLAVFLMALIAYPLTKPNLKGKNGIAFYIYFTMLFSGGLVPTYILITQYLHMRDTIWVYILPGVISPWYVFMMRTFFQNIPNEIGESAIVDGASEYRIFFTMILPLSKPVIATVALFTFLAKWNDWYTAMLYIDNEKLVSLQYLLQRIMQNIQLLQESAGAGTSMVKLSDIPTQTVRMAMAVVVAGPALLVFPFFQKYFVKGLTVGSVKG